MIHLTGKAKEDFLKWFVKEYKNIEITIPSWDSNVVSELASNDLYIFNQLPEVLKKALIVEWFKHIRVFMFVMKNTENEFKYRIFKNETLLLEDYLYNIDEESIIDYLIKKSVEIYNQQNN